MLKQFLSVEAANGGGNFQLLLCKRERTTAHQLKQDWVQTNRRLAQQHLVTFDTLNELIANPCLLITIISSITTIQI